MRSFLRRVCLPMILVGLLFLSACDPDQKRDPFAYAGDAFAVSVEGTYLPANDTEGNPRPFAAAVTVGTPINGDPTLRNLTVTFTAPSTLAGVTVTAALSPASDDPRLSGTVTRKVDFTYSTDYGPIQVTAEGGEFDGFLGFAEALLPMGDVAEVSPMASDGSYTVTRRSEGREAIFTFSEGQDFPTGVRLTDGRGTVELTAVRGHS